MIVVNVIPNPLVEGLGRVDVVTGTATASSL
jgi:hypothetical protein